MRVGSWLTFGERHVFRGNTMVCAEQEKSLNFNALDLWERFILSIKNRKYLAIIRHVLHI